MIRYLGRLLIAADQFLNALANGFPDETFSSRMGRRRKNGDKGAAAVCVVLDAIQENHCGMSIEETPEGETDAHHLGHVIHEIPRDESKRLTKVPALVLVLFAFQGTACASVPVLPSACIPALQPALVPFCDLPDVLCYPGKQKGHDEAPVFAPEFPAGNPIFVEVKKEN